jgi:hypothetical protein
MPSTSRERAPQARCYMCGSSRVTHICHHCRKLGCSAHVTPTPRLAGWPLSRELRGLDMGKKPAYHCPGCAHFRGPALTAGAIGAATALAGAVVLLLNLPLGLALIVLGIVIAGGSYVFGRRRRARQERLPLPVLPRLEELSLREELRGQVILRADGEYQITPDPVEGRLTANLMLGKTDRRRLEGYLRRYRISPGSDVEFCAGFLVFKGQAGISLSRNFPSLSIPLDGTTSGYPVFGADRHRASSSYRIDYTYDLIAGRQVKKVPVWITPAIAPRSDQRALELQIQWLDIDGPGRHLELEDIESLELKVPIEWGNPIGANKAVLSSRGVSEEGNREEGSQVLRPIEWAQLRPNEEENQRKRLDLVVRFEDKIEGWDNISGRLDMVFKGAISGIERVHFYSPLGNRLVHSSAANVKTHVVLDFDLSLTSTRYQDIRLVPDRRVLEDQEREKSMAREFAEVIPNDDTVIRLTDVLSEQKYYIKRVIENPRRSGPRANLIRRYWDIAGRRYSGVYPIDFHIILTGEEISRGGIRAHSGMTKACLTVQGSYANPDMRNRVERAWDQLCGLIMETLQELSCPVRPGPDPPYGGGGDAGSPAPASGGNGVGPHPTPRNTARLLELLGLLHEAHMHGHISDERYREIRAWVQQQLAG